MPSKQMMAMKCAKCWNHKIVSRLRGHKKICPINDCNCDKCQVVTRKEKHQSEQVTVSINELKLKFIIF